MIVILPRRWVLVLGRALIRAQALYLFTETVLSLGFNLTKGLLERIVVSAVMAQCSSRKKRKILSVLISFLQKLKRARDLWTNLHGQG